MRPMSALSGKTRQAITVAGSCWIWTGKRHEDGYGKAGNGRQAHRVIYEKLAGPIPVELELDHTCRIKLCVNPQHLDPVTRAENMRRRAAHLTHCKSGHEFNTANTYRMPKTGHRACRICRNVASLKYRAKRRGA